MKDWWQKLTIDWPCALGDWLWAMLVVVPAGSLDKLTRRRVLHVVGIVLLLIFFQQVVMFDLTFLFGVDLGLLMEVCAAIFVLTAREQASGIEAHIEVKPTYGLADTQIAAMLQDAIGSSKEDMALRSLREAQVDARRMLDATQTALNADAELLTATELQTIRQAMYALGDMLETEAPLDAVRKATAALGAATDGFAAKRMNASISKALAGKSMDSLA